MAVDKLIHMHEPYIEAGEHDHIGMASHRRRIESAENLVWEWRNDQVEHLSKRIGWVEGDRFTPFELERLQEVRAELEEMCP